MLKRIGFIVGLFLLLAKGNLMAQIDTEFWFAAPSVTQNHGDSPIELRLSNFSNSTAATVTVSQPANSGFSPITVSVPAGGSSRIDLSNYITSIESKPFNQVIKTGLHIVSNTAIEVFYTVNRGGQNAEIFTLKGENALGTRFFTPFQTEYENPSYFNSSDPARSGFSVIAKENGTQVTFNLSKNAENESRTTFTVNLNKGEVYTVVSNCYQANCRLAGSQVTSNKPIAITTFDDSIELFGSKDLAGDQLVPTNIIGTDYIVSTGFLGYNNVIQSTAYIVATENDTKIEVTSNGVTTTLATNANAGSTTIRMLLDPEAEYIKASKPIYVLYLSGFGGEVGSPLLPPIKCTGSSKVSFIRTFDSDLFLVLLAQDEGVGSFNLEGLNSQTSINTGFKPSGLPGWSVLQIRIDEIGNFPTGDFAFTLTNTKAYFHAGIINGTRSNSASFAYFSDYGKLKTSLPPTLSTCPNVSLVLDPNVFGTITSKAWRRNGNVFNGGTISQNGTLSFIVPKPDPNQIGPDQYTLELGDNRECTYRDTVRLTVFAEPKLTLAAPPKPLCSNNTSYLLDPGGNFSSYQWEYFANSTAGASNPGNPFPSIPPKQHAPMVGGIYKVSVTDLNGCKASAQVDIDYRIAVVVDITNPPGNVCNNINFTLASINNPAYNFKKYNWVYIGNSKSTASTYKPNSNEPGAYRLDVEDQNDCPSSDIANVNFVSPVSFDLGNNRDNVCLGENFIINLNAGNSILKSINWYQDNTPLQSGLDKKTYKPTAAGNYKVDIVDNNDCPFSDAIAITKFSVNELVKLIDPSPKFCSNSNEVLRHQTPATLPNFKTYKWKFNGNDASGVNSQNTYAPTQTGSYTLEVVDNNNCPSSDSKNVNWTIAQTFNLGNDQNVVCTNSNYNILVNGNFNNLIWKFNTTTFTPTSGNGGKTHKPIKGQEGSYEVTGTDVNGCSAKDDISIGKIVDSTKLTLTQPPNNVCSNAGFKIDVSPNNLPSYSWFFNNGSAPAPNIGASYTPRASGTYRVVAVDANTCITSEKVAVNFVDTTALNIPNPPSVFCANNTTYIIDGGNSFTSYVLKLNGSTINFSNPPSRHKPILAGRYLIEASDSRGCKSRDEVFINYKDTVNFKLPQLPTVICDNANGNNITTTIDAGSYNSYAWLLNNQPLTPNISSSKHRPVAPGTYTVTITDANNCPATSRVFANFFQPLTMKITPSPNGNIACWNTNYTLSPTSGFTIYQWIATTTPALLIPTNTFAYKPTRTGKYKVIGTDANTCKSADSITITYVPDFKLNLGNIKAVCTNVGSFTIDATKPNIVRYDWSNDKGFINPPISQSTFPINQIGKYAVKLTDNNGCMDQDTLDFKLVKELPLELGNKPFACSYENYDIDATSNYQTYLWTNTAGLPNPNTSTSKFKVTKSGNYKVTVTDASGTCTATDDITISYVEDLGFQLNNNFSDTICFNDLYPSRFILAKDSLKFTNLVYNWSWKVPNGETQPGNVVKFQPITSGRYIVSVQDKSNACFDSDTADVSFSRLLANYDLGNPNDTICFNVRDSITSTLPEYRNTAQYQWKWRVPSGAVNPGLKPVAYPDRTGNYVATLEDRFKCKASDSVFVQFSDSLIDFDLGSGSQKICISVIGDQKTIKATNRRYDNTSLYKWIWTVPSAQQRPGNVSEVTPIKSGNYAVLITDKWGCKNSDSKNIEYYDDLFGFKIKSPKDTICFNAPLADLTIKATKREFDNLSIYQWTWVVPKNSKIVKLDSSAVVTDTSGKYIALIVNKENKCSNRDSTTIIFSDSLKKLVFTDPFDTVCFNSDLARKTIEATDKKYNDLKYYSWKWTLPDASNPGNVFIIEPKLTGVYAAKVTDVYGCEASAAATITFSNDLFIFNLGPAKDTICFNAKKILTDTAYAKPQYTWQWKVLPKTKIVVLNDNKIEPDSSGKYIAVVKNTFECFNSDTVDVIFSDSLLAFTLAKPSDTICFNADSLKKMITTKVQKYKNLNEYSWEWLIPNGSRNPGNNFYAIPSSGGNFQATVRDRWKCKASSTTSVNFSNNLFDFDLGKPADTVCFNVPKTITSTKEVYTTNAYQWEWTVPNTATPPNGVKVYQPKVSGKYTVKITNLEKCDNRDSVDITFSNALESFSLGALKDTVCYNQPADSLKATDPKYNDLTNFTWAWDVPNGQANVGNYYKIFPRVSGPFTAKVKDKWECKVEKSVQVIYGDSVKIGLNNADTTACSYADYVIDAGSGYIKYEWNIPNYTFPTYRPIVTGKYKVKVTNRFGCTGSDSVNVLYVPAINTQLLPIKDICDSDSLNQSGIITASSGFDTYKWMDNPPGLDTFYRPIFPRFNGNSINNKITLTVTLDICTATASVDITFIKKDNKYLGPDTTVCLDKPVVLDAGPNFYSYVWKSTNSGDSVLSNKQSIIVTKPDFYYVDLVSKCGNLRPSRQVDNFDTIRYNFIPDSLLCIGEKLDIKNLSHKVKDKYHYTWYEKYTQTFIDDTTSSITVERDGNYQVIVKDIHKCIRMDSVQVTMTDDCFTIPNLFTPNGDDKNPTFFIRGIYKGEWELEVYNRWGDRVYLNSKYDNSWTGDNLAAGVYYYELRNPLKAKKFKGWVQIAK